MEAVGEAAGHQGSRRAWVAVAVVLVVAAAGTAVVLQSGITSTSASSTSASSSSYASSTAASSSVTPGNSMTAESPASGLELSLSLNASAVSPGQGVSAEVEETNTQTTRLNVSASSSWPVGELAVGPCGTLNLPIGLAVFSGNYAAGNVSSAKALQIFQPGTYACPMILSQISSFSFQASSDNATVFGECQPSACLSEQVQASVSFGGYWSGGEFTNFQSGTYTVVAGDEWGAIAVLHFTVASSG